MAVDSLSYAVVLPVLPFAIRDMGGGAVAVALVFSAFSVCQFVAAPLLGRASDRWGRGRVLRMSQIGTLVGFVMLFLARSPDQVLAARIVDGLTAGNLAVVYAAVCDLYSAPSRAGRFALLNTAAGAGILVGLGLCAALTTSGFRSLAAVGATAAMATVAIGLAVRFPPPGARAERAQSRRFLLHGPASLRRCGVVTVAVQVLIGAFAVTLPALLYATIGAPARTGIVVAAVGLLVGIAVQGTAGVWLNRRLGDRVGAAWALAAVEAGVLLLAAAERGSQSFGLVLSTAGAALVAAGLLSALAATTSWLSSSAALGSGLLMGVSQSLASAGQLAGPALGFLAFAAGPAVLLGLLAGIAVAALATCLSPLDLPAAAKATGSS